ncbi:MAG: hypothetical protein V3S91_03860 [Gemmatimonadota bacterium]
MKTTRDFDLSFRPETYWEHGDPTSAILSGIKGEARRLMVRESLETGQDVPEWLLDPLLDEEARHYLGAIHPLFMGGEYVPPDLPGETTIARIALRSVLADVIEVRARPGGPGLLYRIVDEYETDFVMPFDRSVTPLSLGKLIELINDSEGLRQERGLVSCEVEACCCPGGRSRPTHEEWLESVCRFVTVSSQFYPDLQAYYETFVEEWLSERGLLEDPAGSGDGSASGREAC